MERKQRIIRTLRTLIIATLAMAPGLVLRPASVDAAGEVAVARVTVAGTYLVLGSFRLYERAERLVETLSGFPTAISVGVVERKVWFRALSGPYSGGEIEVARERLAAAGITEPWPIRLCADGITGPPCSDGGIRAIAPSSPG